MDRRLLLVTFVLFMAMCGLGALKMRQPTCYQRQVAGSEIRLYAFRPSTLNRHGQSETPTPVKIRLLVIRHANEQMAINDATRAKQGAERAASKGLAIKIVGDEYASGLESFKEIVEKYIQKDADPGDTLIVHTIGHGHPTGALMNLGQREGVFKALADASEKHSQEILWWQLSCHAAAHLPAISSLTPEQQALFSALASSPASQQSPSGEQCRIMASVFMALAEGSKDIDPNGDGIITAGELKDFLNHLDSRQRGDLLFSRSNDEPIFGEGNWPNLIPIIDHNNPQQKYPKDYIPIPKR